MGDSGTVVGLGVGSGLLVGILTVGEGSSVGTTGITVFVDEACDGEEVQDVKASINSANTRKYFFGMRNSLGLRAARVGDA